MSGDARSSGVCRPSGVGSMPAPPSAGWPRNAASLIWDRRSDGSGTTVATASWAASGWKDRRRWTRAALPEALGVRSRGSGCAPCVSLATASRSPEIDHEKLGKVIVATPFGKDCRPAAAGRQHAPSGEVPVGCVLAR